MNQVEERIWDYIDGLCTLEEQETIKQLIANDPIYSAKYEELIAIEYDMNYLELDEPAMAFTNRVMDKISLQSKPLSASAVIDKKIIYGIAALLGFTLFICLGFAFTQIDWSIISLNIPQNLGFDYSTVLSQIQISTSAKNTLMYSFFMFDTVAGLMLLDKFLRKKAN